MTMNRRDALWLICQLSGMATLGLQGCGTDTDSMSPIDRPQMPDAPDTEALDILSQRLPLSELTPLIKDYLTDQTIPTEQDPLNAIAPLGERWFAQQSLLEVSSIAEYLTTSLDFMTSLPPGDITPELIGDRIAMQYDTVDVVDIGGWWMTPVEAAFCAVAFLVLRAQMMSTAAAQSA